VKITPPRPDLQLPGYTLIQRIGSGGYGEVWRASAPGGLTKAIKIVFGRSDQTHAASELRALEKIKSVRHPFLLSLERFEIVEDRLLVVMELADGSLRDRFRDCREAGQPGIERGELLRFLRDAADALDYLGQQHDLQHLDIKPENLLLVGGHVKIADFGLVKDLHAPQASIIGGMTPTYAAPELFQGRPSAFSDQYSLAIIYQEMLTGTVPFDGTSAAELTLQHINELPSLDALCESDRFVISQALAKDPEHRFPSCCEMIDALMRASTADIEKLAEPVIRSSASRGNTTHRKSKVGSTDPNLPSPTLLFDEGDSNWARETAPVLIELPSVAPLQIVSGPEVSSTERPLQPTLIIGIGGSGGSALEAFRAAAQANNPTGELPPSLATLYIDSNPQATNRAQSSSGTRSLGADEVLCCPLRKPQDYREKSDRLLRWLSRRWLYNIPRSLKVSGIRPLGRLVFVDHARQIMQRIRQLAKQVADAAEAACHGSGSPLPLRVYFVGSASGGSASGMLNDLAYATRAVLEHTGLKNVELIAIVTHSPNRESELTELTRINSFAWLTELAHWCQTTTTFPGDESAGIPPSDPGVRPFDQVYVLDLGDRVDDRQFDQAAQDIADYLFLDALTPAGAWIDACRRQACEGPEHAVPLRTFAVSRSVELEPATVAQVASKLLELWGRPDDSNLPEEESVATGFSGIPDSVAQFTALARQIVDEHLDGNAIALLGQRLRQAGLSPATLTRQNGIALMNTLIPAELQEGKAGSLVGYKLSDLARRRDEELALRSAKWLAHLAGTTHGRPAQVLREVDNLSRLLASVGDELQVQAEQAWQALQASLADTRSDLPIDQQIVDHWRKRLHLVGTRLALHLCEGQSKCLQLVAQDLDTLVQTCRQLAGTGNHAARTSKDEGLAVTSELINFVDEQARRLICRRGGYQAVFPVLHRDALAGTLLELMPAVLRGITSDGSGTRVSSASDFTHPRSAGPTLRFQGGTCSQLRVGPDSSETRGDAITSGGVTVPHLTRTYILYEAGNLSPVHVATAFIAGRRDYADMADRVHTRRDVEWHSLLPGDPLEGQSTSSPFEGLVHDTQALTGEAVLATVSPMSSS
jgi:serine/threonine protein kinase